MLLKILAITFGIVSLVTLLTYGIDKAKAIKGEWRIPEKVLLALSLLGGGVGGLCGMYLFHHKTRHWYFTVLNIVGIVWQVGLLLLLLMDKWKWINII